MVVHNFLSTCSSDEWLDDPPEGTSTTEDVKVTLIVTTIMSI